MTLPTIAMTTGEAIVAVAVIAAGTVLALLIVWQLSGLARRWMRRRAEHPAADRDTVANAEH